MDPKFQFGPPLYYDEKEEEGILPLIQTSGLRVNPGTNMGLIEVVVEGRTIPLQVPAY
jgi:hypothetical protein